MISSSRVGQLSYPGRDCCIFAADVAYNVPLRAPQAAVVLRC